MAKPSHRAYTVIKRDNKDDYWLNLGVAFPHEDGEGFNLLMTPPRKQTHNPDSINLSTVPFPRCPVPSSGASR